MLECLILGDSIAVGTNEFLKKEQKQCVSYSQGGINSQQWNKKFGDKVLASPVVIISLGTNDHHGVNTFKELSRVRANVTAERVYWILPPCNDKFCKSDINDVVKIIANSRGDTIISTNKLQKDQIHPSWSGYTELAKKVK